MTTSTATMGPVKEVAALDSYNENAFLNIFGNRIDVQTISGTGHFLMLERPEEFNRVLQQILRAL